MIQVFITHHDAIELVEGKMDAVEDESQSEITSIVLEN